ncbi:DUF1214 domain-containing protein [Mycolicibacterium bacteremicum]|uniref:DUF1214 domain-containing protein n=1 Tax=Mycolicibacterium bacteremicum TaxID=564198 RepID=UPI0026EA8AD3|nr:DUF1214 domain-containing protein [Mycolicibacterium bacteremicum]
MAFGDGSDDEALRAGWAQFCARLQAAGDLAFKDANPTSGAARVDALRFLTQNLGQAFDLALETRDTQYPDLHAFSGPTRKLGGDCADFTYQQAWIDGRSSYRITGHRGSARFFNITVQGARRDGPGVLHEPFGDQPEANMFGHQLEIGADGTFELFIGGTARSVNWLPTTSHSRKLFIRQGFDRWDEEPARMQIERLGMAGPKPLPEPDTMTAAMDWAGAFVTGLMRDWPEYPFTHGGVDAQRPNSFPAVEATGDDARRGRAAANMHWQIGPEQALIIEFDAHDGLWMLTNMGVFFNSMDYRYRPVSYTPSRTAVDADGRIRLVLAHRDPGVANWLDTQGFSRGNLTYRHMLDGVPAALDTRLVDYDRLAAELPAGTAMMSPTERLAAMRQRRAAIARRHRL